VQRLYLAFVVIGLSSLAGLAAAGSFVVHRGENTFGVRTAALPGVTTALGRQVQFGFRGEALAEASSPVCGTFSMAAARYVQKLDLKNIVDSVLCRLCRTYNPQPFSRTAKTPEKPVFSRAKRVLAIFGFCSVTAAFRHVWCRHL
jgi:hypothetical protein